MPRTVGRADEVVAGIIAHRVPHHAEQRGRRTVELSRVGRDHAAGAVIVAVRRRVHDRDVVLDALVAALAPEIDADAVAETEDGVDHRAIDELLFEFIGGLGSGGGETHDTGTDLHLIHHPIVDPGFRRAGVVPVGSVGPELDVVGPILRVRVAAETDTQTLEIKTGAVIPADAREERAVLARACCSTCSGTAWRR